MLQSAVEGLAYGGLYALLGLGFYLTYGVMRRIDLAYGTVVMVSVYIAAVLARSLDFPWYATIGLAVAVGVPIALLVAWLAFVLVRGDGRFSMAATLGIWMAIEELVLQSPGRGRGQPIENPADLLLQFAGVQFRLDHLVLLFLGLLGIFLVYRFLSRSRHGLAIRVSAFDPSAAALLGMSHRNSMALATAIAAATGSCAGWAFAASQGAIDLHFGMWATLKGLVILALAGTGSLPAVAAAAIALGVGERLATELAGIGYRDLLGYGLMLAVLTIHSFRSERHTVGAA